MEFPSTSGFDEVAPSRICDRCGEGMRHLADLPSLLAESALRVFRCLACDNIVSETR
jgi:hypothetical protein